MAKRKKQKSYIKPKIQSQIEQASSEGAIHPNATLGPDSSLNQPSTVYWIEGDSTNAPEIGKESESKESYAQSQWALVDKHVFGKKILPFTLVVILIGWILIQDNGAGKLTNWSGMFWTVQKCGVIIGLFLIILFIQWIYQKIFD